MTHFENVESLGRYFSHPLHVVAYTLVHRFPFSELRFYGTDFRMFVSPGYAVNFD